jgi:hypothetical protein
MINCNTFVIHVILKMYCPIVRYDSNVKTMLDYSWQVLIR